MKKIVFFLIFGVSIIHAQEPLKVIVSFQYENDPTKVDTFCFEVKDIKECYGITSDDFKQVTGAGKWMYDALITLMDIRYNTDGVTGYSTYGAAGLPVCWAPIFYDKKRLYLAANR